MVNSSQKKKIGGFITLVLSSLVCAAAVTLFLVYQYGPTGQYSVEHALLEPDMIPVLAFNDTNNKTGGQTRFVFDKISFNYFDTAKQTTRNIPVSSTLYARFYNQIKKLRSIRQPSDETVSFFQNANPAKLILRIRTASQSSWVAETKIFQEVQFANNGDYFRIKLREEKPEGEWAYFYQPGILKETTKIFVSDS